MAYRIRYGGKQRLNGSWRMWQMQTAMAVILLGCLFLTKECLPGGQEILAGVFLPKSETATEAMALTLSGGGTMREAVMVFCRQVLEGAGYGA